MKTMSYVYEVKKAWNVNDIDLLIKEKVFDSHKEAVDYVRELAEYGSGKTSYRYNDKAVFCEFTDDSYTIKNFLIWDSPIVPFSSKDYRKGPEVNIEIFETRKEYVQYLRDSAERLDGYRISEDEHCGGATNLILRDRNSGKYVKIIDLADRKKYENDRQYDILCCALYDWGDDKECVVELG